MSIITSLAAGVLIGWVASLLMASAGLEDLIRNVAVGIAGAYVGSWLLGQIFGSADRGGFSVGVIVASLLGAATLVLVVTRMNRA